MVFLLGIFYFTFGAIAGSFLNVVVLRYNTGLSIRGRSACLSCGEKLSWFELIPLLSFFLYRGRCRTCGSSISPQYPLVEALTGLLYVSIFLKQLSVPYTFYMLIIASLLVAILVYDMRHKIIPDGLVYAFILLALFSTVVEPGTLQVHIPAFSVLASGPLLFLPFYFLWFVSSGAWMGLGDGKLALGIGWFFGIAGGLSAIMFAFWIGAAVSVFLLALSYIRTRYQLSGTRKVFTIKSEVPFAPFLILGFFIVFFFDIDIISLITL